MLHHVSDGGYSPCIISTEHLIQFLDSKQKYISIDELFNASAKKYEDTIAITIDDGLYDLYAIAYPLLVERKIPFTAFISADLLDQEGYITTEQLKEIVSEIKNKAKEQNPKYSLVIKVDRPFVE